MAITNNTPKSIMALPGNIASITKASSPLEAIIIATRAPKVSILWEYSDTVAKPPTQPGMRPITAPKSTATRKPSPGVEYQGNAIHVNTTNNIVPSIRPTVNRMNSEGSLKNGCSTAGYVYFLRTTYIRTRATPKAAAPAIPMLASMKSQKTPYYI